MNWNYQKVFVNIRNNNFERICNNKVYCEWKKSATNTASRAVGLPYHRAVLGLGWVLLQPSLPLGHCLSCIAPCLQRNSVLPWLPPWLGCEQHRVLWMGGTWAWPWCATEWWALLNRVAGFCHLVHLRAECRFCWSMLLHHFKSWTYISSAADYVVNPLVKSVWWVWHSLCCCFVCLWMSCATVPFFSSRLLLPCSLPILL